MQNIKDNLNKNHSQTSIASHCRMLIATVDEQRSHLNYMYVIICHDLRGLLASYVFIPTLLPTSNILRFFYLH